MKRRIICDEAYPIFIMTRLKDSSNVSGIVVDLPRETIERVQKATEEYEACQDILREASGYKDRYEQ